MTEALGVAETAARLAACPRPTDAAPFEYVEADWAAHARADARRRS